jgi:hypothetical protein
MATNRDVIFGLDAATGECAERANAPEGELIV